MSTTEAAHLAATTQICRSLIAYSTTPRSLAQIIPRTKRQGLAVLETNVLGSLSGRLDTVKERLRCVVKATIGGGLSDKLLRISAKISKKFSNFKLKIEFKENGI